MSILLLSGDEEAVDALSAALDRLGLGVETAGTVAEARTRRDTSPPLVLIVDTSVPEHGSLEELFASQSPWMRVCVIADPDEDPPSEAALVVPKPFDAMELAALIGREQKAAELDRSRHLLLRQTDQLTHQRVGLERELEHAERLAALGRIAAGMAHEINNPLAVIHASADYIAEVAANGNDEDLKQSVEDMLLAIERIGVFVQHVCTFSRRERTQLVEAPLSEAINVAIRMVTPRAIQKKVTIQVANVPDLLVPHDSPRLSQALMNLLSNAIDATHGHGQMVRVTVERRTDTVALIVEDEGTGIACANPADLFEPFATTKPPGEGTGLGLAIARRIVSDHGGELTLANCDEIGAKATCELPLLCPEKYVIAVIEPDPAVRRALQGDLRREGFAIVATETFGELVARDIARTACVVICDPGPTEADAETALAAIAAEFPNSQRILVTSAALPRRLAVHPHVTKPWSRPQLVDLVRQQCLIKFNERARRSIPPPPAPRKLPVY